MAWRHSRPRWTVEQRRARDRARCSGPVALAGDVLGDASVKITEPVVVVDGATCHVLESVVEAGLRQYMKNGATIPDSVRTFARDVSEVAGKWRMTVQSTSGAGGVSGVGPNSASVPSRTMDSEEIAVLAGITPSGVREAHRCGRLPGRKVGRQLQFDAADVREWLEESGR